MPSEETQVSYEASQGTSCSLSDFQHQERIMKAVELGRVRLSFLGAGQEREELTFTLSADRLPLRLGSSCHLHWLHQELAAAISHPVSATASKAFL